MFECRLITKPTKHLRQLDASEVRSGGRDALELHEAARDQSVEQSVGGKEREKEGEAESARE